MTNGDRIKAINARNRAKPIQARADDFPEEIAPGANDGVGTPRAEGIESEAEYLHKDSDMNKLTDLDGNPLPLYSTITEVRDRVTRPALGEWLVDHDEDAITRSIAVWVKPRQAFTVTATVPEFWTIVEANRRDRDMIDEHSAIDRTAKFYEVSNFTVRSILDEVMKRRKSSRVVIPRRNERGENIEPAVFIDVLDLYATEVVLDEIIAALDTIAHDHRMVKRPVDSCAEPVQDGIGGGL